METNQIEYLQKYRTSLYDKLLQTAKDLHIVEDNILQTEDLLLKWKEIAPEYMVDAIPNIEQYPKTAIAWSAYIGMALAQFWDMDWENYKDIQLYQHLVKPRGFDEMDEYILEEVLKIKIDSSEAQSIENKVRSLTEIVLSQIRQEQIEPQSVMAFHVFAASVELMFVFGVSFELQRLGYKYTKIN